MLILLVCLLVVSGSVNDVHADDPNTTDEVGLTTAEIVALRGFSAITHHVVTGQGYIVSLVQAFNPKIKNRPKNKEDILFIHGIQTTINCFLVNSAGARPRDLSRRDAGNMTIEELVKLVGNDPASKSLPFLAMNFGHQIWLLNRRGTRESLGHVLPDHQAFFDSPDSDTIKKETQALIDNFKSGILEALGFGSDSKLLSSITSKIGILGASNYSNLFTNYTSFRSNPKYWNYSLDEQARFDVPSIIDYILEQIGQKKLAIVGHSVGGALPLMSLTLFPELAKNGKNLNRRSIRDKIFKLPLIYKHHHSFQSPFVGTFFGLRQHYQCASPLKAYTSF